MSIIYAANTAHLHHRKTHEEQEKPALVPVVVEEQPVPTSEPDVLATPERLEVSDLPEESSVEDTSEVSPELPSTEEIAPSDSVESVEAEQSADDSEEETEESGEVESAPSSTDSDDSALNSRKKRRRKRDRNSLPYALSDIPNSVNQ